MTAGPLASRRFLPLFAVQFAGAFNDNLFRAAMLFGLAYRDPAGAPLAATVTGGVFILPFFLGSGWSGALSDRIDKARVVRGVKLAEVGIAAAGAAALLLPSTALLYATLFTLGAHSTVFGPVKYAILPQHLGRPELARGTALVEAGTFVAILLGQIAGGLLPPAVAAATLLLVAAAGYAVSRLVPPAPPLGTTDAGGGTLAVLRDAWRDRVLRHAAIGISWFFALGAVLTGQFVALAASLHARAAVATLFLALFSVGVAAGSLLAGRLLRGGVSARPVLPAALAIAALTAELAWTTAHLRPAGGAMGVSAFLRAPGAWRLVADLVAVAVAGGVYVVPLYALLQAGAEPSARARAVAANNVLNALVMVAVTLAAVPVLRAGAGLPGLFALLAAAGLAAAASARALPRG